jgi:hypothetical protein
MARFKHTMFWSSGEDDDHHTTPTSRAAILKAVAVTQTYFGSSIESRIVGTEAVFSIRVTRLGEFSPNRCFFLLYVVIENFRNSPQVCATFIHSCTVCALILTKLYWAKFFTNPSGHPAADVARLLIVNATLNWNAFE